MTMTQEQEKTPIIEQTESLCHTLLEQPEFQRIREQIQAFEADAQTQEEYQQVLQMQDSIQQKQQQNEEISEDEFKRFEEARDNLLDKSTAAGYVEAQRELKELQEAVLTRIQKTLELGRLPTDEELKAEEGGCCGGSGGGGCGCA